MSEGAKDATSVTQAKNRAVRERLPFADTRDFEDARRGFLGTLPEVEIRNAEGRIVWSLRDYAFLAEEQAPPTVNPSLWRQARLNMSNGLFQVTDRIYQVRGFDISNMTLIEGERGLIVVDPLISTEVARAGLDLYARHRGPRPVTAVIYTHSHTDHYGGVRGVVDERDVRAGRIEIIAPDRVQRAAPDAGLGTRAPSPVRALRGRAGSPRRRRRPASVPHTRDVRGAGPLGQGAAAATSNRRSRPSWHCPECYYRVLVTVVWGHAGRMIAKA